MNYNMTVEISDPNTEPGKDSTLVLHLKAMFNHTEGDYGNGYHVMIKCDNGFENFYDLRYNKDFHGDRKISFLADWADNYWNGFGGAYKLDSLIISHE